MPSFPKSQFVRRTLPITVFSFAAGLAMQVFGWLAPLENLYYDSWHLLAGKRQDARYSAVVAVDDTTLSELKDDPLAFWQPHFAKAMETLTLAGVKAIGLDFIYTVSAEAWLRKLNLPDSDISRNYDSPFRAQLAAGNKILITQLIELPSGELEPLLPPPDHLMLLPQGLNDLGIANLYPDGDKIVRHFAPVVIPDPQFPGIGFSTQLAFRAAGVDPTADAWDVAGEHFVRERKFRPIGYIGPPGTVPRVSMGKLLKPDALDDPEVQALKGRVVIIAADNSGTQDFHFSPYSRQLFGFGGEPMIGGEIHTHIIETILSGISPHPVPNTLQYPIALLLIGACTVVFLRLHPAKGAAFGMAAVVVTLVPVYLLFLQYRLLDIANIHAGISVAFLSTLGLRLTGEERKRRQVSAMFGQYVSDVVVDRILSGGGGIPKMGGETVEVTVLFSDIRNFTTISEKLDAQEVVEMLNTYFEQACEPILAQGGMVNKFIGDAIMAVFGSPVHYDDHARRALVASVEIVRVAHEFRAWMEQRFPGRDLPPFGIGIGVHTGQAVMGDIGSTKRREFTAIGDTVNVASRLEGVTKEFGCVLVASGETVKHAGPGVDTGKTDSVHVKGKADAVEVIEIRGVSDVAPAASA
ncbi:MAG: adenylate/guanylate cyclase domain-containing protein [Rhodocyclales bacterium]|nr:adenylate/guanylate cyclase domain-containing protein [Rhodocyclales bacterium]